MADRRVLLTAPAFWLNLLPHGAEPIIVFVGHSGLFFPVSLDDALFANGTGRLGILSDTKYNP